MDANGQSRARRRIGTLLSAAALITACGTPVAPDGATDTFDGTWVLAEGTGPEGDVELDVGADEPARVTLAIEERDWSGTAACNSYSGDVSVADGAVAIDTGFMVTEMACEPLELMETESAYLSALASVDTADLTTADDAADALTLTGPDTLLRFTRETGADTP